MKKNMKMRIAVLVCALFGMFTVVLAEPGANDDPLISKSYIDNYVMPAIEKYIEGRIADVNAGGDKTGAESESFQVVNVAAGKEVICSAGAELILRMGKATIIATEKGGIADTTAGYDLANGTAMPSNHLLIVPVGDGRGFKADVDAIVMIKGGYTIR